MTVKELKAEVDRLNERISMLESQMVLLHAMRLPINPPPQPAWPPTFWPEIQPFNPPVGAANPMPTIWRQEVLA